MRIDLIIYIALLMTYFFFWYGAFGIGGVAIGFLSALIVGGLLKYINEE